jgi:hypothetical protein
VYFLVEVLKVPVKAVDFLNIVFAIGDYTCQVLLLHNAFIHFLIQLTSEVHHLHSHFTVLDYQLRFLSFYSFFFFCAQSYLLFLFLQQFSLLLLQVIQLLTMDTVLQLYFIR